MRLYQRGNAGTWWADYMTADARRVRRSLRTSSREIADLVAEKLQQEAEAESDADAVGDAWLHTEPETLEQLLERWVGYKTARHADKPATARTYTQVARNVVRHLGSRLASSIGTANLVEYQRLRLADGRKSTTVNHEVMLLRSALRWAGISAPTVEQLRGKPDRPQPLSEPEVERLLQAARSTRLEPVILLALECGLRRDEIRYLRWCDVDLATPVLYVQRQPGWSPKSHQSRAIPISSGLAAWLKQHRVGVERRTDRLPRPEDPVAMFEPANEAFGPRWSANALCVAVSKLWIQASIPRRNRHALHALRATFASRSMLRGGDLVSVQALMGHSDITTTRGYLNHNAESLRRAVDAASSLN